ncbi:metallopeptidase family protein [Corynebacterium pelargi]|uniref:Possibl zinc metallo-peptidase n=1 Tax=Corynebacterium pelargi TaxID=1471400 RepID=A0A410W691_9CORY|nr:metallopeptidase family protein [Corynebacterium pelargi]QAU51472.1 Possibl zinc metallo-peptidase [Corynebacterium pelargi]GGG79419.1 hypothetical protein GCM10007338_17140 [Corynebacterium pelargi]
MVTDEEFEELVDEALAQIPTHITDRVRNLAVLIEDAHPDSPGILGLYQGVPLTERTFDHAGFLPDTITIYRTSLKNYCSTPEELVEQIRITVLHEIGHYFGMDHEQMHRLGIA